MGGHALLVPIGVEALVVNNTDKHSTIWSLGHKQYNGIGKFEPLEPPPFIKGNNWPRTGVSLHWALPDGLTRGEQDANGRLTFPLIPNRWLVVRTIVAQGRTTTPDAEPTRPDRLKAWVVESDYLGADGSNLYPDPRQSKREVTKIGRRWEIENWGPDRDGEPPAEPHLTAVGPGDITFTAYLANIDNVLTFHDPLTDLINIEDPATLSYLVVGWYADPGTEPHPDPLALDHWQTEENWQAILTRHKWSLGGATDLNEAVRAAIGGSMVDPRQNFPARTICHGQVYGVNWAGLYGAAQTGPLSRQNLTDARNPQKRAGAARPQRTQTPHVAFGNSAIDALAAMMEYFLEQEDEPVDISTLIQALEYGLVNTYDEPGGQIELDQRIHAEWFAGLPGGARWQLTAVPKEQPPDEADLEGANRSPAIPTKLVSLLHDLNIAQEHLEKAERKLQSLQQLLYAFWWKSRRLPHLHKPPDGIILNDLLAELASQANGALDALLAEMKGRLETVTLDELLAVLKNPPANQNDNKTKQQVETQLNVVDIHRAIRDRSLAQLEVALESDSTAEAAEAQWQLQQVDAPRYYQPTNPVALIYGMRRAAKHGEDGRFTDDGTLFVRFSADPSSEFQGQTIRALQISDETIITSEDIFPELNTLPTENEPNNDDENGADTNSHGEDGEEKSTLTLIYEKVEAGLLPPESIDLIVEATLLDVAQANYLSELSDVSVESVRRRQQMIWRNYRQLGVTTAYLSRSAGFTGVRPSPVAVTKWSPPWAPLFLCWRVTWYPSPPQTGENFNDYWHFNGLDYEWTGRAPIEFSQGFTLQGRTLLTKTSTAALEQHLESLFRQVYGETLAAAESDILARIKEKLQAADLLSQPLIGFNDQLIMQDPKQFYDPDDAEILQRIGDIRRAAPMPYKNGAVTSHFYPIRAGHFRLQRLWVVDTYGQVFDPIYEQGVTPASFTPIRGSGLVTPGLKQRTDTQMLQLPPRLIQASRFLFRFIPAHEPATPAAPTNGEADPALTKPDNPVCGWLLPNHLDNSLAVYDAQGAALGAVILSSSAEAAHIQWLSAVGDSTQVSEITNSHLLDFVSKLIDQEKNADAFTDLMATIDRTLWTTDPMGQRQDNLSTLIGRPLALVRARLELEMAHAPVTDQAWAQTLIPNSHDFENTEFPVQLGHAALPDDGTVGYFIDEDNYEIFHAVQPKVNIKHKTYIQKGLLNRLRLPLSPPGKLRDRKITLLVDPRGSIHARCGILPVKAITLPAQFVDPALAVMDVTFRIGPLVNEPTGLHMPLPADIRGGWSWIAQTGVDVWPDEEPVSDVSQQTLLGEIPLALREGWLKLSDALGESNSLTEPNQEDNS